MRGLIYITQSCKYTQKPRGEQIYLLYQGVNSICGEAEYTQKPRGEQIYLLYQGVNSICGEAEYTQKPREEQIYLLYQGAGAYMDTRTNIPPTNIFALLKCLNVAKDLLIVRHLACVTSH